MDGSLVWFGSVARDGPANDFFNAAQARGATRRQGGQQSARERLGAAHEFGVDPGAPQLQG
jgi:hypothetical protein